jgi:hypothetical protein
MVTKMQNLQKCYTKGEKAMMQMNRKNIKSRKNQRDLVHLIMASTKVNCPVS